MNSKISMIGKRILGVLLAAAVTVSMVPLMSEASYSDWESIKDSTEEYMYSLLEKNPVYGSEWIAMDLARGGCDISEQVFIDYYENLVSTVKEKGGILSGSRYTEYSKAVLAVKALGRNPENVGGYDLLAKLTEVLNVEKQGINGPIWALIALDACGYESEAKGEYIEDILNAKTRLESGGWKLSTSSEVMDVDITAMAVTALAPYAAQPEVKEAVDDAVYALEKAERGDGTYGENVGMDASADSTAQVITAFCSLGIECGNMVQGLLSFRKGNGFSHVQGGAINNMATDQAYRALAAYERFKDGSNGIYDLSDVEEVNIPGPGKVKVEASALSNERISVKWSRGAGDKGYQISFGGKYYYVSGSSKVFTGLDAYRLYRIKVRAYRYVNGDKVYGLWSAEKSVKATYTAPAKPAISSAKSTDKRTLTVKWKKVSYAKGYQVAYRKKGSTYRYVYADSLSKKIGKLKSQKTYQVKVRAYKIVNGKKKYGSFSSVKTVKVK